MRNSTATLEALRAEIDRLSEANAGSRDLDVERRLVRLRHLAGVRLVDEATGQAEFVSADTDRLPAGDPLPEISASELTPGLIRAGILRDGCLLVRGLVPRERRRGMAQEIDRAFERARAPRRRALVGARLLRGVRAPSSATGRWSDGAGSSRAADCWPPIRPGLTSR